MSRWAFVAEDGVVISILDGGSEDWPDLRALDRVRAAPNANIVAGWRWKEGSFTPPLPLVGPRTISPVDFRGRFTPQELEAITLAAWQAMGAGDARLQVYLYKLSTPENVDLDSETAAQGLALLVAAGLLEAKRVAALRA